MIIAILATALGLSIIGPAILLIPHYRRLPVCERCNRKMWDAPQHHCPDHDRPIPGLEKHL